MRIQAVFILLLGVVVSVYATCKLTSSQIDSETRIFATGNSNNYTLLRTDTVSNNVVLQMLCPGAAQLAIATTCTAAGVFNPPLPIKSCSAVKATVERITDADCAYQSYAVGYRVNNQFLELYRSCYDQQAARALYTKHSVFPHTLTTSRPTAEFTLDRFISSDNAATFRRENIYARFNALLGPSQRYINSSTANVISRGHLTPSADYLFRSHKQATFKYINVVPQFQANNLGNWKQIENWIRTRVKRLTFTEVVTGAHDVLQIPSANGSWVQMYLGQNQRNPIPKWLYKIVRDVAGSVVFLTYNDIQNRPGTFSGTCKHVACPADIKFNNTLQHGATICCSPVSFRV